mgnify:CR=1 FL=1
MRAKYKRVLLKISGEALAGTNGFGLDEHTIAHISENIKKIVDMGVQVSIVVGGGNIWRGRSSENMDRTRADHTAYRRQRQMCIRDRSSNIRLRNR